MRKLKVMTVLLALAVLMTACAGKKGGKDETTVGEDTPLLLDCTEIAIDESNVTVNSEKADGDTAKAVYIANDIVYYESGKDFTYGEGNADDAHAKEEADSHTVIHISKPGMYSVSGKLSKGQIAVDLGDDAKDDPSAVVSLVLNGVDITCSVAPAVIFYNVYECCAADEDSASNTVDTTAAGARVIVADDTVNNIQGSYVARIYKPDTVELSEDGTHVEDAKKLHKYDGAFYSKMSMNIDGGENGTGIVNITAENEGMDSEMHLTVNGATWNIISGNDGINTNEDGVSVTTVNGGAVNITVTGETGEGDGIDSNGWLVINGGSVVAFACGDSADSGIDSDMGIHINGGTVLATGNMLDRIESAAQTYAVFNFAEKQRSGESISMKNEDGGEVFRYTLVNDCSVIIYSDSQLKEGSYTLWSGEKQLCHVGMGGGFNGGGRPDMKPDGGMPPEDAGQMTHPDMGEIPEMPEMQDRPERPEGQRPVQGEGEIPPEGFERPDGEMPEMPEDFGEMPPMGEPNGANDPDGEKSVEFQIADGANMFNGVTYN